jgi:hypothetical protein
LLVASIVTLATFAPEAFVTVMAPVPAITSFWLNAVEKQVELPFFTVTVLPEVDVSVITLSVIPLG